MMEKQVAIKTVAITGLHGIQNVTASLNPGLNILFGKNGTGKTTLLHILANVIECDIERFCHLHFNTISIDTYEGANITLVKEDGADRRSKIFVSVNGISAGLVTLETGTIPSITELLRENLGRRPVYLPAFRSVLEAITRERYRSLRVSEHELRKTEIQKVIDREKQSSRLRRTHFAGFGIDQRELVAYKTILCREWFGHFVPIVRYPSLVEVSEQIISEIQDAEIEISGTDRQAFKDVFYKVLSSIYSPEVSVNEEPILDLLTRIEDGLVKLERRRLEEPQAQTIITEITENNQENRKDQVLLGSILKVLNEAIEIRNEAHENAFRQLRIFENSVNKFLSDKRLNIDFVIKGQRSSQSSNLRLIDLGNEKPAGLSILSSGERQVLTMLFSATHMSISDGVLLIDEPELSLHVDWQRIIIQELMKQAGNRQIIACTHSPEVAADYRDVWVPMVLKPAETLVLPGLEESLDDSFPDSEA
jgi:ABC-type cobalamin/Fe3+-siderophores transport system ATPase subunit